MFAVIFEIRPKKGKFDQYLELAKYLRGHLEKVDGLLHRQRALQQHWRYGPCPFAAARFSMFMAQHFEESRRELYRATSTFLLGK